MKIAKVIDDRFKGARDSLMRVDLSRNVNYGQESLVVLSTTILLIDGVKVSILPLDWTPQSTIPFRVIAHSRNLVELIHHLSSPFYTSVITGSTHALSTALATSRSWIFPHSSMGLGRYRRSARESCRPPFLNIFPFFYTSTNSSRWLPKKKKKKKK